VCGNGRAFCAANHDKRQCDFFSASSPHRGIRYIASHPMHESVMLRAVTQLRQIFGIGWLRANPTLSPRRVGRSLTALEKSK
jgi:hypothetical protein